jgi:mannose-6-phosphate isomerase-like protein (cupin superfamily)
MIRNQHTVEHYKWGHSDGWRLLDRPDLSVIQERMPPGSAEVKHLHRRARQLFYVLEGKIEMEIRGEVLELGAGDALEVAPGESHRVRNTSSVDASLIVISAPSTSGDREENEPLPAPTQAPR